MSGFVFFLHAAACIMIVAIILMQSGRGGGLTEGFASAESMFGAKTNEFLVRITTVLAVVFLTTSLSLAFISSKKGKSIMSDKIVEKTEEAAEQTEEAVPAEAAVEKAVEKEAEEVAK